ncbi:MAG: UDP-N-acetylmuramoyl-L-alanine--D-glutamate ligase, partial [Candidatus Vogelbacteria bacterium]|nr:UDP-N-acetylmuramoyl-L-alanine--D-glutamate ligase [Candidatus Vogelbacteria bacterium]
MKKDNPFAGKKVTILGLGLLGGAVNDAIFLAKHGAELTITDLKSAGELKLPLDKLKKFKGIKYVLGEHRLEDFQTADMVLQPGNVPLNSPYLAEAKKNNIPVFVSESLFAKYLPEGVMTIGITGTRGKSTTAGLIFEILKADKKKVFLAGNTKGVSTLALLDNVKKGDYIVMELDSWALHSLGEIEKSPNIAVFTNLMVDHQNFYHSMDLYFADKAQIFSHQGEGDELVCGSEVLKLIQKRYKKVGGRAVVPDAEVVPSNWKIKLLGEHNRQNIAYAVTVAHLLDVSEGTIKRAVGAFKPVPGRLELVAKKQGISYYNDTTATTPEATLEALKALKGGLSLGAGIILISGGSDKGMNYRQYVKTVPKEVKNLILFKDTATE